MIAVATIKKLATGSGRAEKEDVEVAAYTRWAYVPGDDNESDALWIAEYARRKFMGEL
jgi:Holliday junction resolvasome RuvABC endonuclease subunit